MFDALLILLSKVCISYTVYSRCSEVFVGSVKWAGEGKGEEGEGEGRGGKGYYYRCWTIQQATLNIHMTEADRTVLPVVLLLFPKFWLLLHVTRHSCPRRWDDGRGQRRR